MSRHEDFRTARCPISFDNQSNEHASNWVEIFREMRATCPLAWSGEHGGFWVATRYSDIVRIAQQPDLFTSTKFLNAETGKWSGGLSIPPTPFPAAIPIEMDKPEWTGFRHALNRWFGPKAVEDLRPLARTLATGLIDRVIATGRIDLVNDLSNPLPAMITMHMMGFPLDEWRGFADPLHEMAYLPNNSPEYMVAVEGMAWIRNRVGEEIARRRAEPRNDLLGHLVTVHIDGAPLDDETIQQTCMTLLIGGVDTTTALTSHTLLYLGRNPDERQRLIGDPSLLPFAREEFVRFFTPVHALARNVSQDLEFNGEEMRAGEPVLLAYASANRDEDVFSTPDKVVLDRYPNPHIGFGAGIHRCIGSFLARMMFETTVSEVLRRIPDYRIVEEEIRPYTSIGQVDGWITIPAVFDPPARTDVD